MVELNANSSTRVINHCITSSKPSTPNTRANILVPIRLPNKHITKHMYNIIKKRIKQPKGVKRIGVFLGCGSKEERNTVPKPKPTRNSHGPHSFGLPKLLAFPTAGREE